MKSSKDEITQRYLLLFKLDAQNLLSRIKERRKEFVEVFALRRTREHFPWIFSSRYERATIKDLAHCSTETISALDQFYGLVDQMKWYLFQTEDMPSTVEDNIYRMSKKLEKLHSTLNLYLDAEMSLDESNDNVHEALFEDNASELREAESGGLFSSEGSSPSFPEDEDAEHE
ncbi:MAG: hypothetical protein K2P81_07655 [Bacteriovoracaceae bacterium]|nr:hypothetical protein [Bacteriovoracaceae bacterium]